MSLSQGVECVTCPYDCNLGVECRVCPYEIGRPFRPRSRVQHVPFLRSRVHSMSLWHARRGQVFQLVSSQNTCKN
jgi:hypothetical protein